MKKTIWNFFKDFMRDMSALASIPVYSLIFIAVFLLGHAVVALQLFAAFILIWVVVYPIRWIYFKQRPEPQSHTNLLERLDAASFPSIHAARAITLIYILQQIIPVSLFALGWLVAIAIIASRVIIKKHDLIDVAAGALVGFIVAYAALALV